MRIYLSCSLSLIHTLEKEGYIHVNKTKYTYMYSIPEDLNFTIKDYKHNNISKEQKLRWKDPIYREKIAKIFTSKEYRENHSKVLKKTWQSQSLREKQSKITKEAINRPEVKEYHRQRTSEGTKKAYRDKPEIREKVSKALKHAYATRGAEIKQKEYITKKKNHSFSSSSVADAQVKWLQELGLTIEQEKPYPNNLRLHCDIYIKELDLWIECHYSHYHNYCAYNETNEQHQQWVKELKEKSKNHPKNSRGRNQYDDILYNWTDLDVRKRENAKKYNLNYICFYYSEDFDDYFYNLGYKDINKQ
jgi:hypothetical protein